MNYRPHHVACGSGRAGEQHPLVTSEERLTPGSCLICKLIAEKDTMRVAIEMARELLEDGKHVQAHRALESATASLTGSVAEEKKR